MSAFDAFGGGLNGDVPAQGDLDRAVARARAAFAWRAHVDTLTAQGRAEGVVATVSGNGALTDLRVPTSACSEGGDAVTGRILQAIAAAQAELATLIRQSSHDAFGEDSDQAKLVSDSLGTRFRPAEVLGPDETR
ncbi:MULTISPECIES: hypothetical protein [unclassified Knoellia]|uniref:hypothetical protein n=1 Tax=Knoellia altitudinis TaxID=3404795 RepID=UPI00360AB59A